MINKPVFLPELDFYDLSAIGRSIADLLPKEPDTSRGMECLTKKLEPASWFSREPQYLFQKTFFQSTPLTEDDRELLTSILPDLPEIHHFMSDDEIEHFFEKYYKHPKRPIWEPLITTPTIRGSMRREYENRIKKHCENYLSKVKDGTLRLFDANRILLTDKIYSDYVAQNSFVLKEDAILFIKFLGLTSNLDTANTPRSPAKTVQAEAAPASSEISVNNQKQQIRWTPKFMAEVAQYRDLYGAQAAAEKFQVSTARIREKLPGKQGGKASVVADRSHGNAFDVIKKSVTRYGSKKKSN